MSNICDFLSRCFTPKHDFMIHKIIERKILFIVLLLLFNGCALFTKKNPCGDCPKWSKVKNDVLKIEKITI